MVEPVSVNLLINPFHMFFIEYWLHTGDFLGGASGKEPACQCRRQKRPGFDS